MLMLLTRHEHGTHFTRHDNATQPPLTERWHTTRLRPGYPAVHDIFRSINMTPQINREYAILVYISLAIVASARLSSPAMCDDGVPSRCTDTDAPAVMAVLREIRDAYSTAMPFLSDFQVAGTIEPGNRKFRITSQGGKWRLDKDIVDVSGNKVEVKRMYDGRLLFYVNKDMVGIEAADLGKIRREEASFVYSFFMPETDNGVSTVSDMCDFYIDAIKGNGQFVTL